MRGREGEIEGELKEGFTKNEGWESRGSDREGNYGI